MARPRSFSTQDAVAAATGVFWSKGYQDTAISDLEQATGLNRSSLYAAFGTKQAIFELALESYLRGFIEPRLAPVERAEADAGDIERFFTGLAGFFRTGSQARQGCLMINSIAEHAGRGTRLGSRAQAFRDRLSAAFANAMAGRHEPGLAGERAQLLTATTLGIWLTARIDPAGAAQACDAAVACIRTWQQAPAGHGGGDLGRLLARPSPSLVQSRGGAGRRIWV